VPGAAAEPGRHASAEKEQQRGAQHQPGNQVQKRELGGDQQDARAEHASDDAGEEKRQDQAARVWSERVAIREGAGHRPGPERDGVGGVRGDRRHSGEKQRRKRNEAAAACNGVHDSGNECGEKKENGVAQVHATEYMARESKSCRMRS